MLLLWFWDRGFQGRIDQVREPIMLEGRRRALFVATDFYVWYGLPLIPFGTYALIAVTGLGSELGLCVGIEKPLATIRIPFSLKSMIFAYLRASLALCCPVFVLVSIVLLVHGSKGVGAFGLAAGLSCPLLLRASYRVTRSSAVRAMHLRKLFESNSCDPCKLMDEAPLDQDIRP